METTTEQGLVPLVLPTFTATHISVAYIVAIVILLWIIISRWLRQRQYMVCVVSMAVFIAVMCWMLISITKVPVEEPVATNRDSESSSPFFRFQHALMSVDHDFHRLVLGDFQCHSIFQACQPFDGKQLMKFMDALGRYCIVCNSTMNEHKIYRNIILCTAIRFNSAFV